MKSLGPIIAALIVLSSCSQEAVQESRFSLGSYKDPLTGCEYLSNGHGLTPRMGKDGRQICEGLSNGK